MPPIIDDSSQWSRWLYAFAADLKLWLLACILLLFGRMIFLVALSDALATTTNSNTLMVAFFYGLRFDLKTATLGLAPLFAASIVGTLFWQQRWLIGLRRCVALIMIGLLWFASFAAVQYYIEFSTVIDARIFGTVYDGFETVIAMLIEGFHLLPVAIINIVLTVVTFWGFERWTNKTGLAHWLHWVSGHSISRRVIFSAVFCVLAVVACRGGFDHRSLSRKWSSVTTDPVLNVAVLNPINATVYAIRDHMRLLNTDGITRWLPDGDVIAATKRLCPKCWVANQKISDLDQWATTVAQGPKGNIPKHIFVIVMESYDAWPMQPQYAPLQLTSSIASLGKEGIFFDRFLPASTTTMASFASILTGLPDAGVYTARRPSADVPYPSSLGVLFQRLGYRTRLFYGGMLSWQRLGRFGKAQGFEEIYGRSQMDGTEDGPWGLPDATTLNFAESVAIGEKPSLNVILTLSNHPPFDVDIHAAGFKPMEHQPLPNTLSPLIAGHIWYTDKFVGQFARSVVNRLPNSLVVMTGDHYGRRAPKGTPAMIKAAVPLVMYGPQVLQGITKPSLAMGGHIDIVSTLVELCAPKGFAYPTYGHDLLSPIVAKVAVSATHVLTPTNIMTHGQASLTPWIRYHNDVHGIAWWRIMRGAQL